MPTLVGACVLGLLATPTAAASPNPILDTVQITIGVAGEALTINDPANPYTITVTPRRPAPGDGASPWVFDGGHGPVGHAMATRPGETLDVPAPGAGSLIAIGLTALAARQRRRARTAKA